MFKFAKVIIDNDTHLDTAYLIKIYDLRFCIYEKTLYRVISMEEIENEPKLSSGLIPVELKIEPIFNKRR